MTKIGIILGSTRPNRNGEQVARWVLDIASQRTDAEFELVDLLAHPLPHLDEPLPPSLGQYAHDHTEAWAAKVLLATATSSSPPSTTTALPASSRTRSTTSTPSGTTRPSASSPTA